MLTHNESALAAGPALDGARLRQLRRERGFSARNLAEQADLCVRQISRMEAGHRPNVRAVTVARIALALTTTMDYLIELSEEPVPYSTERPLGQVMHR
jgi:transcriptional regulator with XRE-family HTH domain